MLALTGSLRYYFVAGVTDMRLGQYRLCRVIEQLLHRNPSNGDVAYVVWCPTSDGTHVDAYTLPLPKTKNRTAVLVNLSDNNENGTRTALKVEQGAVRIDVSERPAFILLKK